MTCCLVATLPGVIVAAADTRVAVHHGQGEVLIHDGPSDLRLEVTSHTRTVIMPYRYRKIRYLGKGWAVVAGEFASASVLLEQLRSASAANFTAAKALLNSVRSSVLQQLQEETGIGEAQLSETILLGSELNSTQGAWCIGLREPDPRTNPSVGDYVINYPNDVPPIARQQANGAFEAELVQARNAQDALGLVKAATRVIEAAASHSQEVSRRVQIGVTVAQPSGGHVSRYFDSSIEAILSLTPADFFPRSESAA